MTTENLTCGSFQNKLEDFLSDVTYEFQVPSNVIQKVRTETIRCIFGIQDKAGYQTIRSIGQKNGFREEFKFFKHEYLDHSYYVHCRLWKNTINLIQDNIEPEEDVKDDVEYCLRNLTTEDLKKIHEIEYNKEIDAESIDLDNFIMGKVKKKTLDQTIKSKSSSLTFISNYDYGQDMEDFHNDLYCETIRVKNIYHKSSGKNLVQEDDLDTSFAKYLDTSLNNKVLNLKEYNTYEVRRRVASTHAELYKERKKLKKRLAKDPENKAIARKLEEVEGKINNKDFDYYSTVCSLHRENSKGEGKDYDVQEIYQNTLTPMETYLDESFDFDEMCMNLTSNVAECVKIIIGNYNEGFERWAEDNGLNLDKTTTLVRAALDYCKVSKKDLKNNSVIREFLGVC